jgi:Arc/MetJ family transcription regulator
MRTTLDLDDDLMERLLRRFPGAPKTRAVEHAIEGYLSIEGYRGILELEGALPEIADTTRDGDRLDRARQDRLDRLWGA